MIAVDTSVLAWAANRYAPEHARAAKAVEALVHGDAPWGIPVTAVHEFVRLVTHPHGVARPLGAREALGFVRTLLERPGALLLTATDRHLAVVAGLLEGGDPDEGLPGGLETAALLREHGVTELLSADRAMRRYGFLAVIDPVHGPAWSPSARPARRYRRLRAGA